MIDLQTEYRAGYQAGEVWINSGWVTTQREAQEFIDMWKDYGFRYPMRMQKRRLTTVEVENELPVMKMAAGKAPTP